MGESDEKRCFSGKETALFESKSGTSRLEKHRIFFDNPIMG